MPRGRKSKLRARERRFQARSEMRRIPDAHASTTEERETPSSSPLCSSDVQSISAVESQSQRPTTALVSISDTKSDEGNRSQDGERPSTSWAQPSTSYSSSTQRGDIAISLVQFMLRKYNKREPITKEDILKHVIPQDKENFPNVLKKASELMVLAFGIDVKEIDTIRHCYALVSILNPNGDEIMNGEAIMPKSGLLVTILCVIFIKGSCANEEYIWEVLSVIGIYAGVDHFIYGNVKKLITKDFVSEGYLEYRRVPYRGSSCYQFLWGPRAQFETGKMRVLEFLAKVHDTVPSAFPSLYQDALRDKQERTQAKFTSMILIGLMPGAQSNHNCSNFSNYH
ncbi:Melanoma-associated antigen B18 [Cricetulus griseus]|uniref:Melanoma-associated antigen B18 n=1 Tax=Cricetulus griseus TaxID=10029 RepID=G3I6L6_CRIGR|nr:Melanoma-associated antigen B18 [Cricetulus griseus]